VDQTQGAGQSVFRILKATYGKNDDTIDSTNKLNSRIKNGRLTVILSNEIAGDPVRNVMKIGKVKYTHNGKTEKREYVETEEIDLP
jgi:hypothetical protein